MARKSLGGEANKVELNLTSLIDAVFLLLIFFMVTTVFVKSTQLKIDLPIAENADTIEKEKKLNLRISNDGSLEVNSQMIGGLIKIAGAREITFRFWYFDYYCRWTDPSWFCYRCDGDGGPGRSRKD